MTECRTCHGHRVIVGLPPKVWGKPSGVPRRRRQTVIPCPTCVTRAVAKEGPTSVGEGRA